MCLGTEPKQQNTIHPSIHPLCVTAYPIHGRGGGWGTPWTGRQTITGRTHRDRQPFMLTFTPMGNLESTINLHVFGLWEEAGEPGENPR